MTSAENQIDPKSKTIKFYLVGGFVRDEMLGLESKDIDYAVEAPDFDTMREHLLAEGYQIFLETPKYLTIRARSSKDRKTADFVLCRSDGEYHDSRRPTEVKPGTIFDDLARRDFTINAMARDEQNNLLDPHDGQTDLNNRLLRCVGSTQDRMRDDSLRSLRAIRFAITKDLTFHPDLWTALNSEWLPPLIDHLSAERIHDELEKAFAYDTIATLDLLNKLPRPFREAIFRRVRLAPTLRRNKHKQKHKHKQFTK